MDIINKLKNGKIFALVAQLDRATDYGSVGWGFDSFQVHQKEKMFKWISNLSLQNSVIYFFIIIFIIILILTIIL